VPSSFRYALTTPARAIPPPPLVATLGTAMVGGSQPFLGYGLVRPFVRDQKNDFANGGGVANVKACVGEVLGVRASNDGGSAPGELRWRPLFGSLLYLLRHSQGPALPQLARHFIAEALLRWEPRVTNVDVTAAFFPSQLLLRADLVYDVIAQNVAGNNVLFQGVTQQVSIPTGST
jgi:phage baseplate assembly protein W